MTANNHHQEKVDRLFGKVAVTMGVITEEQLREALDLQRFMRDPMPLGKVLVKTNMITEEQLQSVLASQNEKTVGAQNSAKSLHEDNLFGKVAVGLGYLTEDELEECVNLQVTRFRSRYVRLGDIMVQRGFLSPRQVAHILQHQRGLELFCPRCDMRYNVVMFKPGATMKCYRCEVLFRIPESVYKPGFNDLTT